MEERVWNRIFLHDKRTGKSAFVNINDWSRERIEHYVCLLNNFMMQLGIDYLRAGYRIVPNDPVEKRRKRVIYDMDYIMYHNNLKKIDETLEEHNKRNPECLLCADRDILNCYHCLETGKVKKLT